MSHEQKQLMRMRTPRKERCGFSLHACVRVNCECVHPKASEYSQSSEAAVGLFKRTKQSTKLSGDYDPVRV